MEFLPRGMLALGRKSFANNDLDEAQRVREGSSTRAEVTGSFRGIEGRVNNQAVAGKYFDIALT